MPSDDRTVLVVDRDRGHGKLCERFLQQAGYQTLVALDRQGVLAQLRGHRPDVLLLGIELGDEGGLEVCGQIRADDGTRDLPIVVMGPGDRHEDVAAALQVGADDYMIKPVRSSELYARVESLVRRKKSFDEMRNQNREMVAAIDSRSQEIAELYTLSVQLSMAPDLPALLSVLVSYLTQALQCGRIAFLLPDRKAECFRVADSIGVTERTRGSISIPLSDPLIVTACDEQIPLVFSCADADAAWALLTSPQDHLRQSVLAPLLVSGDLVALLVLGEFESDDINYRQLTALTQVSHAAAIAIKSQLQRNHLRATQDATIIALAKLAEFRDETTGNHLIRVQTYCQMLAQRLQASQTLAPVITPRFIEEIWRAAPLHDIGKVGIPDSILLKQGRLTPEEFSVMQRHTVLGAQTIESAEKMLLEDSYLAMAREICLGHHEKWDGSGYPFGLRGDAIPLAARILACADVYDALTTLRPYKRAFDHTETVRIITAGKGSHFDPDVVEAFVALEDNFARTRARLQDEIDAGQNSGFLL